MVSSEAFKYLLSIINIHNNKHINIKIYIHMNIHSKKILDFIKKEDVVTSSEVAEHFGVSWNTADSYLKELLIEDKVKRIKKKGVNLWMLK